MLAKETGAKLHLCHCSTAETVEMVKRAKEAGVKVTAEVTPHHFTLSSDDIPCDDANFKMNPPLRSKKDVEALKEGLSDGIMDAIATDHAPHTKEEKNVSMRKAPFGITGLETAAALTWSNLVEPGYLTSLDMARVMSFSPAKITGIKGGTLDIGEDADVVILNVSDSYLVDPETFASKGKNTPFTGREVKGRVKYTICGGEVIYSE